MASDFSTEHTPVKVTLPEGVRAAVALSYDTDAGCGYAEPLFCHGRTPAFLHEYMLRLCDAAEAHGARLHFMQIGNGLEDPRVVGYVREILDRGHVFDSHTYTHMLLNTQYPEALSLELELTNRLFEEKLGWKPIILRGPGGYDTGLDGLRANQEVILKNGFRWVSGRYCWSLYKRGRRFAVESPTHEAPYAYPTGLIEIPLMGYTDRVWFDYDHDDMKTDQEAYALFRVQYGDKPVPEGWVCPWTAPGAYDGWIEYVIETADYTYDNGLLWTPCWHPYTHYLHDPECRVLPTLLQHMASKPEKFLFCTLRDAAGMLSAEGQ